MTGFPVSGVTVVTNWGRNQRLKWWSKDSEGAGGKRLCVCVCVCVLHGWCRGCHLLLKEQSLVLMAGCQWQAPGLWVGPWLFFSIMPDLAATDSEGILFTERVVRRSMCICLCVIVCGGWIPYMCVYFGTVS